jgi:cell division protein FtsB
MERINSQEDLIRRYLLGELSEAEKAALEDEYFIDPSEYDRLCKAEDELVDRYARGALPEADRERFERSYLTNPRRRRHVMFARALTQVVDESLAARQAAPQTAAGEWIERPDTGFSWLFRFARLPRGARFALSITAALLIGLGGTWLVIVASRLRAQLAEAAREGETHRRSAQMQAQRIADLEAQYRQLAAERERLQAQLQAEREKASPTSRPIPVFFALSLRAFRDYGGQEPLTLIIPRGAEEARLQIHITEHAFPSYQVMLLTTDGKEVFAQKGVRPQATRKGTTVTVSVPTRKFADGHNIMSLSGISGVGEVETLGKVIVEVKRR